jgi:DNA-binding transcriptional LysR family regulator
MQPSLDLNLLVVLDALLTEGSVTGAAEKLDMSVPAMSRALARIRRMLGDPVFVRAGRGLAPTPRAEALREGTRALVEQAEALLRKTESFDLSKLQRVFTIRADDGMVSSLGPLLLEELQHQAPGVSIRFSAQGQQDVVALREGHIDLDIGVISDLGPEIVRQTLLKDKFVAVFRTGHPLEKLNTLTPEHFAQHQHVTVSRRGLLSGPVDVELAKIGLSRRIQAVTSTFVEALTIASHTDLIATVPDQLTRNMRQDMTIRELPVHTASLTISQAWHPRFNTDPGHKAMRGMIYQIYQNHT